VQRPVLSLLLVTFVTFFFGLGRQAITDSDEAFYAEAAREMVETGDWLTPHFNYEDRWQKPALYYWLTAATYRIVGPSEFGARLWSALSGLGLVLLAWWAARRMSGDEDGAWLAGSITATSYGYFAMTRAALPDLPLAFFITLGIWSALERRWWLAGAAAGFGFLMKGPVAVVLPGLVLLSIWWRERAWRTLRVRDLAIAACIFAAIGLPWYAAMWVEHGPAYLRSFFIADNLERFATDRFNEPRAFWFYLPVVIGGLMPWAAYLIVLPARSLAAVVTRARRLSPDEWRLVLWAVVPLLFYTLSIGKQPRYILPVLPPLAILLARSISASIALTASGSPSPVAAAVRRKIADLRIATWITAATYAVLAILLVRARLLFVAAYPAVTWLGVAAILAAALLLAWLAVTGRWTRLPLAVTACAAALLVSLQFGALAGRRPEAVDEMATLVLSHRAAHEPVAAYHVFVRNLIFYTGLKQKELFDDNQALEFMKSPDRILLVVSMNDLARLKQVSGIAMRPLGAVQYLDPANVRLRTLLWPMPAQDLDTVLLVTNR
jgi:4-amino-4-deoxy-L-arabinose transferase-like glycosyltransferase